MEEPVATGSRETQAAARQNGEELRPVVIARAEPELQAQPALPPQVTSTTAGPPATTPAQEPAGPAVPQPGFDLARVSSTQPADAGSVSPAATEARSEPSAPIVLLPATEPAAPPVRVADAFADLAANPAPVVARAPDAVDITRIKPPREVEKKPEPVAAKPPPPPPHPSRHWVQLATGRDKSALRFDWRRFARQAPEVLEKMNPYVTPWGQANRLLAGPYDSPKAANAALAALKKAGLDGFVFTSEAGQAVDRLP